MLGRIRALALLLVAVSGLSGCGGGGGGNDDSSVPPVNRSPQAVIGTSVTTGYAPLAADFDGTSSSDSDGSITTYTWIMGDGNSYSGAVVSHTYSTLGSFSVTLTVTDDDGASSSTSVTIDVYAQAAGPYFGDVCSNITGECIYAYGMIGSDHRVFLDGYDNVAGVWNRWFAGSINVNTDLLTGNLTAEIDDPYVFLDGSQIGIVAIDAVVDPQSGVYGSYSGVGDNGFADLIYNTPIDTPASLARISGSWSWSDGLGYTDIMVVDADGSFTSNDTDGCNLVGRFTLMDSSRNEYGIEYDLSCPPGINPAGDGHREGLALIDDFYEVDIWLYWFITFDEGPRAGRRGGGALMRPRASASIVDGVYAAKPQKLKKRRSLK